MERVFGGSGTLSERSVQLFQVLGAVRSKAVYVYDFGDAWEHRIVVEKILAPDPGSEYPTCLAGERRGPPEDCGGIPGFHNLLCALDDREDDEHADVLEWLGEDFDPAAFSVDEVNRRLAGMQRQNRKMRQSDPA